MAVNAEPVQGSRWDGERHLQLLITLHWVATGLAGMAFLVLSYTVAVFLPVMAFVALPLIGLHAAAAMGLKQGDRWGWTVSLIAAIVTITVGLPGIAFGVYAIIVLNRPDVKQRFHGVPA